LVTGGAKRIGAAIVRDLARHDFAVAIHAHQSMDEAQALAVEIEAAGGRAAVVAGDLTDRNACSSLIEQASAAIGPIGLVVNNASLFLDDSIGDFDADKLDRHIAIHVTAPSILIQHFAAELPQTHAGLVVNIIDQRVWAPNPRFYSYTLSKAALWMATQTLAQALAPRIRVNALGPGPTFKSTRQTPEDFAAQIRGLILEAGPQLDEFGRSIRFLFDTPSITGQMIAIDGGQHLAWLTPDIAEINE
jgi:NAD(P)-dependent dehydrogenase (short-subunit alcohol dehydrogenase family)